MPKMLNDGAVEYEDGTPATEAQVLVFFKYKFFSKSHHSIYSGYSLGYVDHFFTILFCCRWGKMLCHSCLGPPNPRWKKENWYVSFNTFAYRNLYLEVLTTLLLLADGI